MPHWACFLRDVELAWEVWRITKWRMVAGVGAEAPLVAIAVFA